MKKIINKTSLFFLVVFSIIFVVQLRHLNSLYAPWIYDDEIGYWGVASFLAGKDWSGILQHCQYYSFGYSLLIAPLYYTDLSPIFLYRAAIILNAVIGLIALVVAFLIAKTLFEYKKISIYHVVVVASVLNATFFFQVNTAWTELLLYMLVWGITYFLIKYIETNKLKFGVLLSLTLLYLYIVHQRMIGVVMVAFLTILVYMILEKKIEIKHILCFTLIMVIGFLIASVAKEYIQNELWKINESTSLIATSNANDYSGQIGKIKGIISTPESILNFLAQFLGKIFYFGRASFLLLFVVIYSWLKDIVLKIRKDIKLETVFWIKTFVCLSILAMMLITTIAMILPVRNDAIIYGRYAEPVIGILILVGLFVLLKEKYKKSEMILVILVSFVFEVGVGVLIKKQLWNLGEAVFTTSVISLARYFVDNELYLAKFTIELAIICLILLLVIFLKERYKKVIIAILCVAFIFISFKDAEYVYNVDLKYWQDQKKQVIELVENVVQNNGQTIYYILGDSFNQNGNKNTLQFLFPDNKVICIGNEDLITEPGAIIFACAYDKNIEIIKNRYSVIEENGEIVALTPNL